MTQLVQTASYPFRFVCEERYGEEEFACQVWVWYQEIVSEIHDIPSIDVFIHGLMDFFQGESIARILLRDDYGRGEDDVMTGPMADLIQSLFADFKEDFPNAEIDDFMEAHAEQLSFFSIDLQARQNFIHDLTHCLNKLQLVYLESPYPSLFQRGPKATRWLSINERIRNGAVKGVW